MAHVHRIVRLSLAASGKRLVARALTTWSNAIFVAFQVVVGVAHADSKTVATDVVTVPRA